jgi:translation initiation factor eIF-2B subunit beta
MALVCNQVGPFFFAELAVGNIVRRVLHIIKGEDISSTAVGIEGLSVTVDSDDEYDSDHDDRPTLSAAVLAAHARNALRAPSLQTLLDDIPVSTAISRSASSTGDSDIKSKCIFLFATQFPSLG